LKAALNQFAQYELCFGNQFHVNPEGLNIKSTPFKISGESSFVFLVDTPNVAIGSRNITSAKATTGTISAVKLDENGNLVVVAKEIGTVDYVRGEIKIGTINITSTARPNGIIEIQAFPESNDVVGLKDLYLSLNISKSTINMVRDVIASGDEISGTKFISDYYTSSYSNGNLARQ